MLGEFYPSEKYPHLKHSPIWIDELSGGWGDKSKGYRMEGMKGNKVVKELVIEKFEKLAFKISSDTMELVEGKSYDVASVRIEASGDIELIGPNIITLKGGFGGFYVKFFTLKISKNACNFSSKS